MQPRLSSSLVRLLFDFVEARGDDAFKVLGEAPPRDVSGLTSVPAPTWLALLQRLARHYPEPALGLSVCRLIAPRHGGVLAYLTQHCGTVAEAFWHLRRYERLVHDLNAPRHRLTLTSVQLRWGTERWRGGQVSDELLMGSLVAYVRRITGMAELAPTRVVFVAPAPADPAPYRDFFGCPVSFGEPVALIEFPLGTLALRTRRPDEDLHGLLERQAHIAFSELLSRDEFVRDIQACITALLPSGTATAGHCARRLNMSARTLQRQLAARNWSYQQLLDRTRELMAESLLSDPEQSLVDIALRLGYAEQAAFTRAFVRWKDMPPGRWRRLKCTPNASFNDP